jgi:uncharacterized protein YgiM (DUF1202 family)
MARTIAAFFMLCAIALMSGVLTVNLLSFTADTVVRLAVPTPIKTYNLKRGYVSRLPEAAAGDFDVAKSVPVVPVLLPEKAPLPTFIVTVDSLRVRSRPTKTSAQVFGLMSGAKVTVSSTQNGWALIMADGGRTGWVYGKFLRPAATERLQAQN